MMQIFWVEGVQPGRLGFSARPRANDRLDDELRGARSILTGSHPKTRRPQIDLRSDSIPR